MAMHATDDNPGPTLLQDRRTRRYYALVPVALALVMGAPALWGDFLSGDDVQLIRDHVLVNHPSLDHLVKLFTIPHRDLYQPIPLAGFAVDFSVIWWAGLLPTAGGAQAGAWVFHLTNVLIHALNALLVWWLVRKLTGHGVLALMVGSLFAVHPLNTECVAWLSGRIMMLSATFTLASLIAADRALDKASVGRSTLTLLMVVAAMMSKVSAGLPILLLLVPFVRGKRPSGRWWIMFAAAAALTVAFVVLNLRLSRGHFDTGGEALSGSRLVRTVIALGWYVCHYVVPVNLSAWHPAEALVTWSHPELLPSVMAVAGLLAVALLLSQRFWSAPRTQPDAAHAVTRLSAAGIVWFFAAVAATLPLVPSRNLSVAERYVYLPAVGFHCIIAVACLRAATARFWGNGAKVVQPIVGVFVAAALVVLVTVAWKTSGHYRNDVARFRRTANLYPEHPGVWTRLAWAHYHAGEYAEAGRTASVELERLGSAHQTPADADAVRSEVWQVQGMSLLRSGQVDEALSKLNAAVASDPQSGIAHVRLATALVEAGRLDDAVRHYRRAVEIMPNYNPGLIGLAQVYRKLDQPNQAAEMFAQALRNNPYDPVAITSLAEIELSAGQVMVATERLVCLLEWMPENAVAHANLAVCCIRMQLPEDALHEYRAALLLDPSLVPPRLGLATLLAQQGMATEAGYQFRLAAAYSDYTDAGALLHYSDFLVARGDLEGASAVWTKGLERKPGDAEMTSWYAWVCVLAGRWEAAREAMTNLADTTPAPLAATLAGIMLDVHEHRPEHAVRAVSKLCADDPADAGRGRGRLERALKNYSSDHAENPWPYYLMIIMFRADGSADGAGLALQAFEQVCTDPEWVRRARSLLAGSATQPARLP